MSDEEINARIEAIAQAFERSSVMPPQIAASFVRSFKTLASDDTRHIVITGATFDNFAKFAGAVRTMRPNPAAPTQAPDKSPPTHS